MCVCVCVSICDDSPGFFCLHSAKHELVDLLDECWLAAFLEQQEHERPKHGGQRSRHATLKRQDASCIGLFNGSIIQ